MTVLRGGGLPSGEYQSMCPAQILRTIRCSWVICLLGFALLASSASPVFVWGWFVGGALSILNLWSLGQLSDRLLHTASGGCIRKLRVASAVKCLGLAVLVVGAISVVSPIGLALGFGLPFVILLLQFISDPQGMSARGSEEG